jgi:hypothetical protein
LIGKRDRRQALVARDGFLAAQFAAAEDKDHRRQGDEAADEKSEIAIVLFHALRSAVRYPNVRRLNNVLRKRAALAAKGYAEFRPIVGGVGRRQQFPQKISGNLAPRDGNGILSSVGEDSVSERDTRVLVRDLYDAYGRRDFDRVAALIHDAIDWVI